MKIKTSSKIVRCLATAAAGAIVVGGAIVSVAPANAQTVHAPAPIQRPLSHRVIPFTTATFNPGATAGTWVVSWSAPHVRSVQILIGSSANSIRQLSGHGQGQGSITVRSTSVRPWFELVPDEGAPLVIASRDLGLASDPNLRDAGGYRTADGQWVKSGIAYRSAALALTPADLKTVQTLGVTSDIDLRTTSEVAATPDVVPAGATYISANVLGGSTLTPSLTSAASAAAFMQTTEQEMVTLDSAKASYHTLFTQLANSSGSVLYHCTAGKDRTGWASAVLLSLLGVPQSTITQDYLLSNTYYLNSPAVQAELKAMPAAEATIYEPLLAVDASYLNAGFQQVNTSYGSMYNYAVHGLGLSPATIAKLQAKFLEGAPASR